ncbi:MAG: hypothetical protein DRQ62_08945 [Gammaproteobacteria bacterium]|nr:MAG: hypothetical protein DRQ62_08945 [Gammaproteobacteria bacterium]
MLATNKIERQAIFLKQCKLLPEQSTALAETIGHEKAHGRVTSRRAQLISLDSLPQDSRWKNSSLCQEFSCWGAVEAVKVFSIILILIKEGLGEV